MKNIRTGRRRSFENYKPVQNHINKTSSICGWMYETFGEEYEFVRQMVTAKPRHVWTVIDGEGSKLYAVAGWHYVNRLGYIITELPWERDDIEFRV